MIFPIFLSDTHEKVIYRDSPEMVRQKQRENDLLAEKVKIEKERNDILRYQNMSDHMLLKEYNQGEYTEYDVSEKVYATTKNGIEITLGLNTYTDNRRNPNWDLVVNEVEKRNLKRRTNE